MSDAQPIRVMIVEDDPGLRRTLRIMVEKMPGIECAGACGSAEAALEEIKKSRCHAVLMDIHLPGMSGVECVRALKQLAPLLQIVMLTVHDHTRAVFESLAAGATGFLVKPIRAAELARAIREVQAGGAPMSPNIARLLVQTFQKSTPSPDPAANLSPREYEVLELLAKGYLQKEIADQLGVSFHTVQTHTARIYEKLHVRSRAQAVAKYYRSS